MPGDYCSLIAADSLAHMRYWGLLDTTYANRQDSVVVYRYIATLVQVVP